MKSKLGLAIAIASKAFKDKVDKGGKPYILHCLRVMHKMHTDDEDTNIVAVLHDLLEDCPEWTASRLAKKGIPQRAITSLLLLTHDHNVSYEDYIKIVATDEIATKVKLSDLKDNSNITRLKGLTKKDFDRMEKYHKAYTYLSKTK